MTKWCCEGGSLLEPEGIVFMKEDRDSIHITAIQIFGKENLIVDEYGHVDLTNEQHATLAKFMDTVELALNIAGELT